LFQQVALLCKYLNTEYIVELGATLFASIDKYQKCCEIYKGLNEIQFIGIEPDYVLRNTASLLHGEYLPVQYCSTSDIDVIPMKSVGRSYQASSYAFESTRELVDWVTQFEASQDGIWFSTLDKDETVEIFSSTLTFFSFPMFKSLMLAKGFYINILTTQKVHHFRNDIYEVFITSHKIETCECFNANIDNKMYHIENLNHCSLQNAKESYDERTVQHEKGSFFDSVVNSGELDFTTVNNIKNIKC